MALQRLLWRNTKVTYETVVDGLKNVYKTKVLPLEVESQYHDFHSCPYDDSVFNQKPMILLMGQYSTGKTTFIRYLLGRSFLGMRIGPEPTTDGFIAIMHNESEGIIPGHAIVSDPNKPFRPLTKFGTNFLNRFQCSHINSPVLQGFSIVDTPGILSGEKQRIARGYDFEGVLNWFAERVDRIILLFDAHKLDISDEFRRSLESFQGHDDKIRIILNKVDMVDEQQLMKVYGALMWSLGKIFNTPEVARVYLGSFWDQPLKYDSNRKLFEAEERDLLSDLHCLPRDATLRKLNDLVKRVRLVRAHSYILSELKSQTPLLIGVEKKRRRLIRNLDLVYAKIQQQHKISSGDFPDIRYMQQQLENWDFRKFKKPSSRLIRTVDEMLEEDITTFMTMIPAETSQKQDEHTIRGGVFDDLKIYDTSVNDQRRFAADPEPGAPHWIMTADRAVCERIFESLHPVDGKISAADAKQVMVQSKLPNSVLAKIIKLSNIDKDGRFDIDEFALAMNLVKIKLQENLDLPEDLPEELVPTSKRKKKKGEIIAKLERAQSSEPMLQEMKNKPSGTE